MSRASGAAVAIPLLFLLAATAAAQAPPPLTEPAPAPFRLGPLGIRPTVIVRDVGYDSNVLHRPSGDAGDFSATFGGRVDLALATPRVQARYASLYEYVYFQDFEEERGSNRGAEGRVEVLLTRVRPYFTGALARSHERPSAEIDVRAARVASHAGVGATIAAFSRTSFHLGYRHVRTSFGDDEVFRGARLAEELNAGSDLFLYGAEFVLSPLTTVAVHGETGRDRFEQALDRDSDSYRVGATATLDPQALISGRASVGVRAFRPLSAAVPDFTGITAAVDVAYAFGEDARLALSVHRDLRYSIERVTPYFISTAVRLTVTRRLIGETEAQAFGGIERLAYRAIEGVPDAAGATDTARVFGGGIGYRLGEGSRLGVNVDVGTRTSPVSSREYARTRVYAVVTYGL
jgi:hypothetical protein